MNLGYGENFYKCQFTESEQTGVILKADMSHPVLRKDKRHQGEKQRPKITLGFLINLSSKKLLNER